MRALLALAALALGAGCYNPKIVSGTLACSADGKCPAGMNCAPDHHCWKAADVARAPIQVHGGFVAAGGPMRSANYTMIGGIGAADLGAAVSSTNYAVVDGTSGQTRTRSR